VHFIYIYVIVSFN